MKVGVLYRIRRHLIRVITKHYARIDMNTRGDVLVAQSMPSQAELTRLDNSWIAIDTALNSALTPTTFYSSDLEIGMLAMQNGRSSAAVGIEQFHIRNPYLVMESMFAIVTVSAGSSLSASLLCSVSLQRGVDILIPTTVDISSFSGKRYFGHVFFGSFVTIGPGADRMSPYATTLANSGTNNLSQIIYAPLAGAVIVPPGHTFSMVFMAGNNTIAARLGVCWHEINMLAVG